MAPLGLANAHLKDGYCFRLCFGLLLFIHTHLGGCQLFVIDPYSPYFSAKTQTYMSKFLPQNSIVSWEIPVQNIQTDAHLPTPIILLFPYYFSNKCHFCFQFLQLEIWINLLIVSNLLSVYTLSSNSVNFTFCACMLSHFSCVWLCDPMDYSLPCSSVHGDFPGKNSGVGYHALLQGIIPTQGSTCISHISRIGRQVLYH